MRKYAISVFVLFCSVACFSQIMIQFKKDTVISWNYEWGDEFNAKEIDTEKWAYWQGSRSIFTNKEQEYYSDGKNHVLENGTLKLIARKEPLDAKMIDGIGDKDSLNDAGKFYGFNKWHFDYTSGMIISNKLFTKGFFEIRFKAPKDKGMWPAFWLAGGYPNEEIDVFELKGERPGKIHVDVHCPNDCDDYKTWYGQKKSWGGWISLNEKLTEGFNVIGIEWQPTYIKYFLNGKSFAYVPVSFKVPKSIEANLAIPSDDGPFHPGPNKNVKVFEPFEIDYIRVWDIPSPGDDKNKAPNKNVLTKISEIKNEETKVKRKIKSLYGKKAVHEKEGAIVTFMPIDKTSYVLYALGIEKNMQIEADLTNASGKIVYSLKTFAFQNKLDFSSLPAGDYTLIIKYDLKTTKLALTF